MIVGLARGIHVLIQNVVYMYSKKEELVDGVRYKNQSLLIVYNSFIVLKLFIACKGIVVHIGCGYYSRAGFILFNESERMDVGIIRGREVIEEILYIAESMVNKNQPCL